MPTTAHNSAPAEATVIYTDGACKGNPGPGGWAWAVPGGRWGSGFDPATTNQRMEITAAFRAVVSNDGPIHIVSDSTYVVNCFRDEWWKGWQKRNWRNSKKEPVANRDLWEPFIELVLERQVSFEWVKGHSGDVMNDLVDQLAVAAAERRQGDSGEVPPGPADLGGTEVVARLAPTRAPSDSTGPALRDPRVPPGAPWTVVGGRNADLIGSELGLRLRTKMSEILAAQRQMHDGLVVLTGLRPGVEHIGALAAIDAEVPYVVVLPYPDPTSRWKQPARGAFDRACADALSVVTLESRRPADIAAQRDALARRDGWLRSVSEGAVVVTDDSDAESMQQLAKFTRALGDEVWELRLDEFR